MSNAALRVSTIDVAGQHTYDGKVFPLALTCENSFAGLNDIANWIETQSDEFANFLQTHGAILFRGFPMDEPQDFDNFISAFGLKNFPYEQSLSNAVRVNFTPRVFSANEAPSDITIYLHHEMAQTPIFPSRLFFFCQQPADEGGATPLCRSDVLFEQLSRELPDFAKKCEENGLKYTNVMPSKNDAASGMGRSWQSTLAAKTQNDAERRLDELGYKWEWLSDNCLRATTPILPAVREVAKGRKVFFNQLIAAAKGWKDSRNEPSKSITFGDGSALDRDAVIRVTELAEELTFDLQWQRGDAVLVDNFLVMHGRRTFRGTRKVLASLAEAQKHKSMA